MDQFKNQEHLTNVDTSLPHKTSVSKASSHNESSSNFFSRLFYDRCNRRNYILGLIIFIVSFLLLVLLDYLLSFFSTRSLHPLADSTNSPASAIPVILSRTLTMVYIALFILYYISLMVRRLHDLNKNGWFWLLANVPVINLLLNLYLLLCPGTNGENQYGAEPLPKINIKEQLFRL
jgi:uncharacterized membrane protein YhaH (DUF805 family)